MYEKQKKYYKLNRERIVRNMKSYHAKRKKFIGELKNRPCMDCGGWFDPVAMDFDHRPNEKKTFNISSRSCITLERIFTEMKKCDIVCANCHRVRTMRRHQYESNINGNAYRIANRNKLSFSHQTN